MTDARQASLRATLDKLKRYHGIGGHSLFAGPCGNVACDLAHHVDVRDVEQLVADLLSTQQDKPAYDADKEARCLFQELLEPERTVDKAAKAMSFLRLWANSYLLNDNYWDVPQTMGLALNQVIAILEEHLAAHETPPSLAIHNRALLKENMKLLDQLAAQETSPVEEMRLRAYRQARVFEPSMEGYHAAMSVYAAAFGKPDGEPTVMLPDGSTKQGWELSTFAAQETAGWQPIATAPKDGTVFLGWSLEWALRMPELVVWLDGRIERAGWYTYQGPHRFVKQPTHWMPLPAPPVAQEGTD